MTITFSYPCKREVYINTEFINVIQKYINSIHMKNFYKSTRKELKKILKENKQISYCEWNEYAYHNGFFSSIAIMAHEDTEKWEDVKKKFEDCN